MLINKNKSSIMPMFKQLTTEQQIEGIPVSLQYKYLGGMIDWKLSIETHLENAGKKINFIRYKLTGLRLLHNTKLNVNLFKMFCMPQYKMAMINAQLSQAEKNKLNKVIRNDFKKFCMIPMNTSNTVISKMIGNIDLNMDMITTEFNIKYKIRNEENHSARQKSLKELQAVKL